MTWAWIETSRAEIGSSAKINSGLITKALAIPIRCLWPPENSCGYLVKCSGNKPTNSRTLLTSLEMNSLSFTP
mgnify:CR=1 FL=1